MARPLEVYGMYTIPATPVERALIEARYGRRVSQVRAIVAAASRTAAARLMGESQHIAAQHMGTTGNPLEIETAMSEPGVVFVRGIDEFGVPYLRREPVA